MDKRKGRDDLKFIQNSISLVHGLEAKFSEMAAAASHIWLLKLKLN